MELNIIGNWIANIVLMTIGYITRLVWGSDKLTTKQLIAFYLFCVGSVFVIDKININSTIKSGIILTCGLVIPNVIRILIKTGDKSETKISDKISDKLTDKADKIIDQADEIKKML